MGVQPCRGPPRLPRHGVEKEVSAIVVGVRRRRKLEFLGRGIVWHVRHVRCTRRARGVDDVLRQAVELIQIFSFTALATSGLGAR